MNKRTLRRAFSPIALILIFTLLFSFSLSSGTFAKSAASAKTKTAVYLGVKNYGEANINKDNRDNFKYRFEINGKEKTYKLKNTKNFSLQNKLKEGYTYNIKIKNGVVTSVTLKGGKKENFTPVVTGYTPGERTLKNFLATALEPVGTTLYIYGGGWDWQDEGSSIQSRTIGVSSDWVDFFKSQDAGYTYKEKDGDASKANPKTSYYPYGGFNEYYYAGLDCSGYLGWTIYNTFETESGNTGYVGGSTGFAKRMAEYGWGEVIQNVKVPTSSNGYKMKPGDVMSINGHVWISLGTCSDGSVVILHSTPSKSRTGQPGGGVQISAIGKNTKCKAYALADKYMSEYYPDWYERYPVYLCNPKTYFSFTGDTAGRFTWDTNSGKGLSDPDGMQDMTPEEVLKTIFGA